VFVTNIDSISIEAVRKSGAVLGKRVLMLGQVSIGLQAPGLMDAEQIIDPSRQDLEPEARDSRNYCPGRYEPRHE